MAYVAMNSQSLDYWHWHHFLNGVCRHEPWNWSQLIQLHFLNGVCRHELAQDFYNQLVAGGMEKGRAEELKREAMVKMGNQLRDALNGSVSGQIDAIMGRNASKDWMDSILEGQKRPGSVSSPKTPKTPSVQAPNVNTSVANVPSSNPKTVTYKIEFGGKSLELAGDPSQQNLMNDFLSELEQLNRAR